MDISVHDIGKNITQTPLNDIKKSTRRFCEGFNFLKDQAQGIDLYIENNVLSLSNAKTFQGQVPLMMVDYNGYKELKNLIDFHLLLDVAHLKVSANALGLDFVEQLRVLIHASDYIHISDNDGTHDQSRCFQENSEILDSLRIYDLKNKIITSETYGSIADIKSSQSILEKLVGSKV